LSDKKLSGARFFYEFYNPTFYTIKCTIRYGFPLVSSDADDSDYTGACRAGGIPMVNIPNYHNLDFPVIAKADNPASPKYVLHVCLNDNGIVNIQEGSCNP
jgi:hypothetical protein